MRITTFFLFASLLHVSAKTSSQAVTISGKDMPLKKIFDAVYKQTGFVVFSNDRLMERAAPITINAREIPLLDFLTNVFKNQPLTFSIDSKTIFLSEKPYQQENITFSDSTVIPLLKGKILDSAGLPIPDVTVAVRNTKLMAVTDIQGDFSFMNVPRNGTLVATNIAYQRKEIKLEGRSAVTFRLYAEIRKLGEVEVVVNTGYQALPKERATGSFGVVTGKQLAQVPVVSILERLQGMVPGVEISTQTTAGKSRNGSVRIRGLSTIKSEYTKVSMDPLLVIDGFPSQVSIANGALDLLNPDDIDQITFLKDAAAASIWGIQAANGVIVVVTKKGTRNSKPVFGFSTTMGTSSKPSLGYGEMMSISQYIDLEKELLEKGRFNDPVPGSTPGSYYPANNSQVQAIFFRQKRGEITTAEMNAQLAALGATDNRSQMEKYMLQSPTTQQYNLSISGGGVNSSYFLSGYFYKEDRVYKNNMNKGYSLKAGNTSSLLNGRITVSTDLTFGNTRDKINNAAVTAMSTVPGGMRPYDMLKDASGNNIRYDLLTIPSTARYLENKGYLPFGYSPIEETQYSNVYNTANNVALNVAVNGNITSWLGVSVSGNVGRMFTEYEQYLEPESYDARLLVNKATSISPTGARVYGVPPGGKLDLRSGQGKSYNLRGQINVNKNWKDRHQLNLLVGNEIRESYNKSSGELRYGYDKSINTFRSVNPFVGYKDIYGTTQAIGATTMAVTEKTTRSMSYYANGSYTFDNKYTLSGSARFDDYNLLGVERRKRAIPLWSAGVKWNLGKEELLSNIAWVDQLSARFTYGFSGNAPQGYAPVTTINLLGADYYTNYPYAVIDKPAMANLGWEKTRMLNWGLDFSFFKNRVFGSAEYYKKHTTDIIWQMPINGTYGFTATLFNTANLEGHGFDLGLNVVPVLTKNWRWTATINMSYNTNIIKDPRFEKPTTYFAPEMLYSGYPTDYLFTYAWAGLDNTGQSLIYNGNDRSKKYSVMEYPYENVRVYAGRTTSPWFGSFSHSIQYKGFDLNVQFQCAFGGVFLKPSIQDVGYVNNIFVGRTGDLANRWRKPGDEATTNVPGLIFGANTNFYASVNRYIESDFLVRSRSNIKLQQVMLSYTIPSFLLEKAKLKSITVSAVARNLGMIWAANKEKLDPDYLYRTGNNYQLPPLTNYSFRVALSF
jgi:TonB-linked SusC/RagA family outer membrane protein